ncbi:Helix-turn-helix domain-containing protein [Mesobacillus persicus]|uniref:Helix-turn-helix domain-containing protein n=1 Tax=Mesobacillus persicus TaxID=930146 RepID=A0A1H7XLJ0_9BACI|nr:helix-turn-helix transcriptional regulator [Mesobacillus persicus]SEM34504.1 Helix-turn-helix domain-containing protein [Mesobacillus persicus]
MEFGAFLKRKRLEMNISAREMCRLIDVSNGYMSQVENGKIETPRRELLLKIMDVLHIEPSELEPFGFQFRENEDIQSEHTKIQRSRVQGLIEKELAICSEAELEAILTLIREFPELYKMLSNKEQYTRAKEMIGEFKTFMEFMEFKRKQSS